MIKKAFEGQKHNKQYLYKQKLAEQIKLWEAFLWRSRKSVFDSDEIYAGLSKDFETLVKAYESNPKKKEIFVPPVFIFKEKGGNASIRNLKDFSAEIQTNQGFVDGITLEAFEKMKPDSLGFTYLEWYDDDETDSIISDDIKELYKGIASAIAKSTLTEPKNKETGKPEDYQLQFKKILDLLTGGLTKSNKKLTKGLIKTSAVDNWSKEQRLAFMQELVSLQAGLTSLQSLLTSKKEIDLDGLKSLALRLQNASLEIAGTSVDLLAIINASYDTFKGAVQENMVGGWKNYVTDSAWANSFFAPAIVSTGGTIHTIMTTNWSELNLTTVAGKAFTTALSTSQAATQAAMFIKTGNEAWGIEPLYASAKVSTDVAGIVTGGIGTILSAHELYEQGQEKHALNKIKDRFKKSILQSDKLTKHLKFNYHKGYMRHIIKNPEYKAFDVILQKMRNRHVQTNVQIGGAIAGIGSGVSAITIGVSVIAGATLANIWNPIGWTFAAISAVVAIGFIAWRTSRRAYKGRMLKKLKETELKNNRHVPHFCNTTGDYWRYKAAQTIFFASLAPTTKDELKKLPKETQYKVAVGQIFAYILFGNDNHKTADAALADALNTAFNYGVQGIMGFIKG